MKLENRGVCNFMLPMLLISIIFFGSRSLYAGILEAPTLPNPVQGAIVYVGGTVLKNQSTTDAADARIGFRIPGIFGENINQLAIALGVGGVTQQIITFGNQFSGRFDQDIIFQPGFLLPPKGQLDISVVVDSKKTNGAKFLRSITLTDDNSDPIKTQVGIGGFVAARNSPLTYTFSNDGSDLLHVAQITLGLSDAFIADNSLGAADLLQTFTNGGNGWDLLPDMTIPLVVPFAVPNGSFLVADVIGISAPNTPDTLDVHFFQEHQEVPEPSSMILLLTVTVPLILRVRSSHREPGGADKRSVFRLM